MSKKNVNLIDNPLDSKETPEPQYSTSSVIKENELLISQLESKIELLENQNKQLQSDIQLAQSQVISLNKKIEDFENNKSKEVYSIQTEPNTNSKLQKSLNVYHIGRQSVPFEVVDFIGVNKLGMDLWEIYSTGSHERMIVPESEISFKPVYSQN